MVTAKLAGPARKFLGAGLLVVTAVAVMAAAGDASPINPGLIIVGMALAVCAAILVRDALNGVQRRNA